MARWRLACIAASVTDPGCLSRILIFTHPRSRIPDPGSRILDPGSWIPDPGSRILDPKTATKERSEKTFVCSHKFHKILHYFSFEVLKKKIWANFQRIIELFTQKVSLSSQKYGLGIRDPRSGIRKKPIPDPGVKKAPDPGSGSATLIAAL
jgi:hypothetical protein